MCLCYHRRGRDSFVGKGGAADADTKMGLAFIAMCPRITVLQL